MKILHVTPATPYGGMQRLVCNLAREQQRRGLQVEVVSVHDDGAFADELIRGGIKPLLIPGNTFTLNSVTLLHSAIRKTRPNLVHLHGGVLWSNVIGLLGKRCPWLYHAHGYPSPGADLKTQILNAVNSRLQDAIIAVSESVSSAFRSLFANTPIFTVYNGVTVETREEPYLPRSTQPTFGMATRFAADKGVLEFIEVAREITRYLPEARFIIAGDGPLMDAARARISELALERHFTFPGFVTDTTAFWKKIHVSIFTSPREAFGLRLIEPMTLGTPVVAYLTGFGSDELLLGGENALVAPWGDSLGLAKKAVSLIEDPNAAALLTERAKFIVSTRFSIAQIATNVEQVYAQVLGKCV